MRVRTLEIRWHNGDPIYSCDFQPLPQSQLKKTIAPRIISKESSTPSLSEQKIALPPPPPPSATTSSSAASSTNYGVGQSFRFATGGSDNNVRIWMVYPNILPPSVAAAASTSGGAKPTPHPPRVEYLATLVKHAGAVNVVRFSPSGEYLASAGDDGMIIIWVPTDRPVHTFGGDPEEAQYEKEHWKPKIVLRCTSREVYDLAWSPNGEYIIAGSTDNTARVYNASDGTCVREIAEHNHYVQGVAWDPLNEYVASQSSDRSVHVYGINTKRGSFDVHAVGKNSRLSVRHSRTPSAATTAAGPTSTTSRPTHKRRGSASASEAESVAPASLSDLKEEQVAAYIASTTSNSGSFSTPAMVPMSTAATPSMTSAPLLPTSSGIVAPPTPTMSVMSTPSMQPPKDRPTSRRSSFSGSAAASPAQSSRHIGRSPSPMPPLPAIRQAQGSTASWATFKMYGDESYTNFFRRLTFSPDGAFLLTPAGHFEDTSVVPSVTTTKTPAKNGADDPPSRPKKGTRASESSGGSKSSVYIYSRANFSRPPIAHLPGHQKASVAVKFSPLLYELRQGVVGAEEKEREVKRVGIERGKDQVVDVDLGAPVGSGVRETGRSSSSASEVGTPLPAPSPIAATPERPIYAPAPRRPPSASPSLIGQRESESASDRRAPTPAQTPGMMMNAPTPAATGSVFALPYRMLYSVATQDTIVVYDTQQAGPVCLFTNLHYASFTDMAWAPDGQSLMLASSDGYCSIVVFDDILPLYHTQQNNLQLQSIVNSHNTTVSPQHHRDHSFSGQQGLTTPHSPALSFTSSVVRGGTPGLTSRELPGGGSLGLTSVGTPSQTRGRPIERSESSGNPVPALGLHGMQGPSSSSAGAGPMVVSTGTSSAAESGNESDVAPPAKKKRRIALTHHVDTE